MSGASSHAAFSAFVLIPGYHTCRGGGKWCETRHILFCIGKGRLPLREFLQKSQQGALFHLGPPPAVITFRVWWKCLLERFQPPNQSKFREFQFTASPIH